MTLVCVVDSETDGDTGPRGVRSGRCWSTPGGEWMAMGNNGVAADEPHCSEGHTCGGESYCSGIETRGLLRVPR